MKSMTVGNMYRAKEFCRAKHCCESIELHSTLRAAIFGTDSKLVGQLNKGDNFQLITIKQTKTGYVLLQVQSGMTLGWMFLVEEFDLKNMPYNHYFKELSSPKTKKEIP